MKRPFRDLPIGRKLMVIGLLTTGVALIALSLALIFRGALEWRGRTVANLETYAAMIGANAAPAVMFEDRKAATDTLAALAAEPSITYGALYKENGKLFADFRPSGSTARIGQLPLDAPGHRFSTTSVALARPVVFKGETLGTLYLQADLHEMYGHLGRDAALILLAALLAFSAGTALFLRLQHAIVRPIGSLAKAMQGVSEQENYALRVPVEAQDEVGVLSLTFNTMLDHIQNRDAELAAHRDRLEAEVTRRTAQLQDANTQLERELVERRRAEATLQKYTQQIDLLSQMAATLQTCLEPDEVSTVVGPFLERLFPEWSGSMFLLRNSRNLLEATAHWGQTPGPPAFAPNGCWALRRGQLHVADPALTAPRCAHANSAADCHMCTPMLAQGEMLGVLHLQGAAGSSTPAEQGLFVRSAGEIAQALANLRYREALKRMAIRDPLTGLFNRRYLEEYLEMEIARATRKGSQLSLVMVDIDRFKQFNDTFGHEAGDEVLREVGKLFTQHIRHGDVACRYGGEEFILAMWETPLDVARLRAERLREDVKNMQVRLGNRPLGQVTLSLGLAAFPEHGATGEDVIRTADRALYRAKFSGRDRVYVATAL